MREAAHNLLQPNRVPDAPNESELPNESMSWNEIDPPLASYARAIRIAGSSLAMVLRDPH